MKSMIGLVLAFSIGLSCRWAGVPLPAPPALMGALLVFAMTLGYVAVDHYLAKRDPLDPDRSGGGS